MEEQDLDSVQQDADPIRQDNDFKTVNVGSGVRVEGRIDGAETADISGALSGTLKSSNININTSGSFNGDMFGKDMFNSPSYYPKEILKLINSLIFISPTSSPPRPRIDTLLFDTSLLLRLLSPVVQVEPPSVEYSTLK